MSGLIFILSVVFSFWYFGGKIEKSDLTDNPTIIGIAISIFSTPILGFVISALGSGILKLLYGISQKFLPPDECIEKEYYEMLERNFPQNFKRIQNRDYDHISLNHQILFRKWANPEVMKYTARRMDIYWSHVNTITSILAGFIIGCFILLYTKKNQLEYSCAKFYWIVPFVIYFFIGWWIARQDLKESNDFEKGFLVKEDAERSTKAIRNEGEQD